MSAEVKSSLLADKFLLAMAQLWPRPSALLEAAARPDEWEAGRCAQGWGRQAKPGKARGGSRSG